MWPHAALSLVLVVLVGVGGRTEQPALFPFAISYDAPQNVTNVSGWLKGPAGADGFVRAEGERLVTDAGPVRFFGTNLCFDACFPDRNDAERLAARLARFGINCVRMHHMDSRSIWGKSPNKLTIDPEQLARLDYLIYQLKQHGIYVNLNLHVSRTLGPAEGFPHPEGRPKYDKGLDNFEPRMIEAQKQYARDLLTHVNPHTGKPYIDEPAVAFVEISNEDALFTVWGRGQLESLPEPYATTFRRLWNAWLREKYGTTEKLQRAWHGGSRPLGREMLRNGDFSQPVERNWSLEQDEQTVVEWSVEPDGPQGGRFLRLVVERQGRFSWRPQLAQAGLKLHKDRPYTLQFFARSDAPRRIGVNCMMAHEPWQRLGLSESVSLDTQWQEFRFTFRAQQSDENARITFTGLKPGRYELARVSLRPGGIVGLEPDERLEDDSVAVLPPRRSGRTKAAQCDFIDFLWDTERDYWWGMYQFLKHDLGLKALVSGTQLSYSPVHIQAALDYIDAHSYWNHPRFPGRPWDPRNWTVRNVALVNHPPGTLGSLAVRRVAGKPFTVSEYNHPAPNQYAAEGFPMLAAFGAFQDWSAVYSFTYSHNTDFEPGRITGFFDIKGDTSRLVHLPACAAMFLRGDVKPGTQLLTVPLSSGREKRVLYETHNVWNLQADYLGLDGRMAMLRRVGLDIHRGATSPCAAFDVADGRLELKSDTGQLCWVLPEPGKGYFVVDSPRTKLFTGFVPSKTVCLGDVRLRVGPTRLGWATVSMVCIDGEGFDRPGRVLVAATGLVKNTGMELQHLDDDQVTLGDRWGSQPILCEAVPVEISLPVSAARVRYYPLDTSGNRAQPVEAARQDDRAVIKLGPNYRTVWYEIEIQ